MKNKRLPRLESYRRRAFHLDGDVLEERGDADGLRKEQCEPQTPRSAGRAARSGDARASARSVGGFAADSTEEETPVAIDAGFGSVGVLDWAGLLLLPPDSQCGQRAAADVAVETQTPEWSGSARSMEEPRERELSLSKMGFDGGTALRLFTPIHSGALTDKQEPAPEPQVHSYVTNNRLVVPSHGTRTHPRVGACPPGVGICPPGQTRPDFTHRSSVQDNPSVSPKEDFARGQALTEYPSYPRTIPRLIVTHDPSPSQAEDVEVAEIPLSFGALSLDVQAGRESPCSDSGCGGSPIPRVSLRKLSSSSSAGLSSASSFEESEDDITGSDVEPAGGSPSTRGPFGSPEQLSRVSGPSLLPCSCDHGVIKGRHERAITSSDRSM